MLRLLLQQINSPPTRVGTLATSFCTACAILKRLTMLAVPPVPGYRLNVTSRRRTRNCSWLHNCLYRNSRTQIRVTSSVRYNSVMDNEMVNYIYIKKIKLPLLITPKEFQNLSLKKPHILCVILYTLYRKDTITVHKIHNQHFSHNIKVLFSLHCCWLFSTGFSFIHNMNIN